MKSLNPVALVILVCMACNVDPTPEENGLAGDPSTDSVAEGLIERFDSAVKPTSDDLDLGHQWNCKMRETWGASEETGEARLAFDSSNDFPSFVGGSFEIIEPLRSSPEGKFIFDFDLERDNLVDTLIRASSEDLGISRETVYQNFSANIDSIREWTQFMYRAGSSFESLATAWIRKTESMRDQTLNVVDFEPSRPPKSKYVH